MSYMTNMTFMTFLKVGEDTQNDHADCNYFNETLLTSNHKL
jgi:hypothetical protein